MAETTTTTIYQALLQAQRDMGPLLRNATNPHFRSKYADLAAVVETISEPLQKNGLVVFQTTEVDENGFPILVTTVAHEAGGTITSRYPLTSKDPTDPQKLGAAVTYARRYALQALFMLAPEDDDGNLAATPAQAPSEAQAQPPYYPPGARGAGTKTYHASPNKPSSGKQKDMIIGQLAKLGVRTDAQQARFLTQLMGKDSLDALSAAEASSLIDSLKSQIATQGSTPAWTDEPDPNVPF